MNIQKAWSIGPRCTLRSLGGQGASHEMKQTLRLGIPLILTMVGNTAMGMINTMVIGKVSSAALAGVAAGNAIFWPIIAVSYCLMQGLDAVVSQALGQKKLQVCDQAFVQSLFMSLFIAAVITPLLYYLSDYYYLTGAKPEVVNHAIPYLKALSLAFAPQLFFCTFQRYWQAQGVATIFTAIIILANGVNYLAASALVQSAPGRPGLGAAGVGYATLICWSFCFCAILLASLVLWHRRKRRLGFAQGGRELWRFRRDLLGQLLRLGVPAAGQTALEVGAFALTTTIIAGLGATMLAAHQVVMTITSFTFMFPLGLASASAVRVGTHVGARDYVGAARSGWLGILAGAAVMGVFGVIICLQPVMLMNFFTEDPQVIKAAMGIIMLAAAFQVFDGTQVMGAGVLRGAGNTKLCLLSNFMGYYIVGLPLGFTLCFVYGWQLRGLWIGLTTGLILTALCNTFFWKIFIARLKTVEVTGSQVGLTF